MVFVAYHHHRRMLSTCVVLQSFGHPGDAFDYQIVKKRCTGCKINVPQGPVLLRDQYIKHAMIMPASTGRYVSHVIRLWFHTHTPPQICLIPCYVKLQLYYEWHVTDNRTHRGINEMATSDLQNNLT